ncbi:MAG: hypothetical protein M0R22_12575 [Dehalococcoidia bacterium]|nr:hypothetical protein [Dehalococcoidia bacterium]
MDVARRLNRWAARRVREIIPLCSGSFLDVSDSLVVRDEGGIRGLLPIHLAVRTVDQLFGEPRILDWLPKYMPRRDEYEHSKDHYWEAREHYGRDVVLSSYLVRFGWRMTLWADRLPAQPSDAELERVDRLRGLLRSEVAWTATELVRIAVNSGWMSVLGDEWVAARTALTDSIAEAGSYNMPAVLFSKSDQQDWIAVMRARQDQVMARLREIHGKGLRVGRPRELRTPYLDGPGIVARADDRFRAYRSKFPRALPKYTTTVYRIRATGGSEVVFVPLPVPRRGATAHTLDVLLDSVEAEKAEGVAERDRVAVEEEEAARAVMAVEKGVTKGALPPRRVRFAAGENLEDVREISRYGTRPVPRRRAWKGSHSGSSGSSGSESGSDH